MNERLLLLLSKRLQLIRKVVMWTQPSFRCIVSSVGNDMIRAMGELGYGRNDP